MACLSSGCEQSVCLTLKASKTCREGFSFYHVGEEAVCSAKAVKCQKQLSDFLLGSYSEGGFQRVSGCGHVLGENPGSFKRSQGYLAGRLQRALGSDQDLVKSWAHCWC